MFELQEDYLNRRIRTIKAMSKAIPETTVENEQSIALTEVSLDNMEWGQEFHNAVESIVGESLSWDDTTMISSWLFTIAKNKVAPCITIEEYVNAIFRAFTELHPAFANLNNADLIKTTVETTKSLING